MNSHRRPQRHWSFATLTIALSLPLVAVSVELDAAPKPSRARAKSTRPETPEDSGTTAPEFNVVRNVATTVRLNYVKTPWSKVLKDYAEAANKELVADAVPAGQFTRWDFKSHEPADALRILNHELEPLGFRLIEKREHLVLIEVKKSRLEYRPAVIKNDEQSADDDVEAEGSDEIVQASATMKSNSPKAKPRAANAPVRHPQADDEQAPPTKRVTRKQQRIEQVSGEQEAAPASKAEAEAETEELKISTVRLKARDAVAVSRIMYNAFKDRAELVDDGPRGLQGFRVYRTELDSNGQPLPRTAKAKVRFTVGIDENHNQLVVEAGSHETPSVLRLIKTLDVLPKEGTGTVRAVSTNKDAGLIASALQPEIDRLSAASRKAARKSQLDRRSKDAGDDGDEVANAENENDNEAPPAPQRPGDRKDPEAAQQPLTAQSLIKSLKGDVDIQSIPDLGIMVIIGNEQDAETVISVIREIERLSAGAVPSVELVFLRHINSEALASLLTSVYDRLSPTRGRTTQPGGQQQSQNVLVIPIVRPNAVLIVAAKVDIDSAKDLAEQLDQPSDPHTEYKIFRLKYAIPSLVVETVEAVYATGPTQGQAQQQQQQSSTAKGALAPQVKITPDLRTNSVIVQARPRDLREVALLIRDLDSADSAAVSEIRIFTLNTAVADELAATLQTAIQSLLSPARIPTTQGGGNQGGGGAAGGGNPELREVKSMILQYLDQQNGEEKLLQSGILADIRITPDMRTNSIVVTAPEQSMELVAKLIKRFDTPSRTVAEIKVFPMEKGDAQSTVTLLNGLFGLAQAQRQGGQQGGQFGQNIPGVQIAGADDASSTLIPIRFNVDVRTNSIVAIGGAEALRVVEAVILRLDESEIRQRKTEVYKLKNTPANDVATAVGNFLQTQRQVETADPGLVSPFEQIEKEVIVVPEPVSNSLLISATPRYFDDIKKVVIDIDKAPGQVLIQALLVEVQLDNQDEFGIELGLQDSVLFDRSLISTILPVPTVTSVPGVGQVQSNQVISATATPGFAFNNSEFGNNVASGINTSKVGGQGLTNFNLGRVNGDLGYGGLVLAAGSESVSGLLRAVAARRRVDVLSRPQIRTLDNQLARIQVGQEVPRVGNFTLNTNTGTAQPIVQQRAIGIILSVQPRITPDGMVVMAVAASKDALSTQSVPLFVNPDGSTVNSPIIDTTNASTTVSVKTGQTIVLGGMITKRDDNIERKVPLLGDIPILGQAFRYDFKKTVRTELLIFLTPRVLTSDAEAERIKEIEAQRMNFIEAEAEMMHGPLFGVPAEMPWEGPVPHQGPALTEPPKYSPPNPPVPGIAPMSMDDADDTPATLMPANVQSIPDEDLSNPDLSRRKSKSKKGSAVIPAGFEAPGQLSDKAGRSTLGPTATKKGAPAQSKTSSRKNRNRAREKDAE